MQRLELGRPVTIVPLQGLILLFQVIVLLIQASHRLVPLVLQFRDLLLKLLRLGDRITFAPSMDIKRCGEALAFLHEHVLGFGLHEQGLFKLLDLLTESSVRGHVGVDAADGGLDEGVILRWEVTELYDASVKVCEWWSQRRRTSGTTVQGIMHM